MSLKPQGVGPIPETTGRFAHAVFPKGNAIMRLRDALGPIYTDEQFHALFPQDGQPALSPGLLALVTVLQFAEGLSDRQAADAVRARIDWKYALALELDDAGFDASVLCEFRSRLIAGQAEMLLFETLLSLLREQHLLKARGKQRTDSTHVLAAIVTLIASNVSGRPCAMRSMSWRQLLLTGLRSGFPRCGLSAIPVALRSIDCPRKKKTAMHWPSKLGQMAVSSCRGSLPKRSGRGFMKFLPSKSCGVSGCSSITLPSPPSLFAGGWRRIFPPLHS